MWVCVTWIILVHFSWCNYYFHQNGRGCQPFQPKGHLSLKEYRHPPRVNFAEYRFMTHQCAVAQWLRNPALDKWMEIKFSIRLFRNIFLYSPELRSKCVKLLKIFKINVPARQFLLKLRNTELSKVQNFVSKNYNFLRKHLTSVMKQS